LHLENFIKRSCAYFIDILALLIVLLPFKILFIYTDLLLPFGQACFFIALSLIYFAYMESSNKQATFGKQFLNLKVVNLNNEKISFGQALLRNVARLINIPTYSLCYLPILFTKHHQGVHDIIARTTVVSK
jgi:hypothetical protein